MLEKHFLKNIFKKMGDVSVQWPVPMDTLGYGHVSKIEHVSTSQRVQWNWPLDTSPTFKKKNLKASSNIIIHLNALQMRLFVIRHD